VLFHQDFSNSATRVSKALCHHRLVSASVVAGAKASGAIKSVSECTMVRVFADEVSTLRSAKLDRLVYTDEVRSAGAAMSPRDPVWSAAIAGCAQHAEPGPEGAVMPCF
jgi:hypothetical protein